MRRFATAIARPLLLATLAMPLTTGLALASHEAPRLGLTPVGAEEPYFSLTMEPGETRFLEVEVANFGGEEVAARTYAADAYSIINGGFGAELFGDEPAGTTLWLDYGTQELTLGPRDALVVGFELSVPQATAPGDYLTSLVVENAEPFAGSIEGDFGVDQVNRSAIAVAISVPGPRRAALEIGAVGHHLADGRSVVTFEVTNAGNVHLKPAGEFVLRDDAGEQLVSAEPAMGSLYAHTATTLEAPLASPLRPGQYCAELRLADEETGADHASECLPFTVAEPTEADAGSSGSQAIPILEPVIDAASRNPLLLGALLIASVCIAAGAVLIRRRRRRVPAGGPPHRGNPTGGRASWPAAEALPDAGADRALPAELRMLLVLRDELMRLPVVERAWLVERDDVTLLAVEGAAGTVPADGARIVRELQALADARPIGRPLRVAYVQGPGPVARATGAAMPFYRRTAHQGQFSA